MRIGMIAILMTVLCLPALQAEESRPPNVILILTDDSDEDGRHCSETTHLCVEIPESVLS